MEDSTSGAQPVLAADLPWSCALVVGMGASGRAATKLLYALGIAVRSYDANFDAGDDLPDEIEFFSGSEIPDKAVVGVDLIVLSPGVPPAHARERRDALAPSSVLHGELSLTLEILAQRGAERPLPQMCLITGTNGKSTITALLAHLLEADGQTPFAGGNLGVPISTLAYELIFEARAEPSTLVLECSSYQLETLGEVASAVAILSNISPDHLARYDSLEHYARTKTQVFAGLGEAGLAILDGEDEWTPKLRPAGRVALVGLADLRLVDGELLVGSHTFTRSSLKAAGRHNAKNALFALRAALELGASPGACAQGLRSFEGLPHRMAFVGEQGGIAYYNDSKATNVASVLAGLRGFERPFVLIAGGQLKGEDLAPLIELVAQEGIALVALGEGRAALAEAAGSKIICVQAVSMEAAVSRAQGLAKEGQAIVLSPAGASWDMYENFGARGDHFVRVVATTR